MFTIEHRNKRLKAAVKRSARADAVVAGVQDAVARAEAARREVEWLKSAPVRDGEPGAGLPSDDELKKIADEAVASMRRKSNKEAEASIVDPLAAQDDAAPE